MPNAPEFAEVSELSEAELQKKLAAATVAGPKSFRGRKLAPYTDGLRDLILKVVSPQDTGDYFGPEQDWNVREDPLSRKRADGWPKR